MHANHTSLTGVYPDPPQTIDLLFTLNSKNLDPTLNTRKFLFYSTPWRSIGRPKYELCITDPAGGEIPRLIQGGSNVFLIVLQIAAEAFSAESRPCCRQRMISGRYQMTSDRNNGLPIYCAMPFECSPHSGKFLIRLPSMGGVFSTASESSKNRTCE